MVSIFGTVAVVFGQISTGQVEQYYKPFQTQFGLTDLDIHNLKITSQYTDKQTGITHVYFNQMVNGLEIYNANSSMHIAPNGKLINLNNGFVANAKTKINTTQTKLDVNTAIAVAGADAEMTVAKVFSKSSNELVNNELILSDLAVSPEPIKVKLYYQEVNGQLMLSYNVELFNNETNDWWNTRIDAQTGKIVAKNNWTNHCQLGAGMYGTDEHQHVESILVNNQVNGGNKMMKTALDGTYNVYPFPAESPNHGARVFLPSTATSNGSPFGWHDTDGVVGYEYSVTRGNNVSAEEDRGATNGTGFSPDGGDSLYFDYPMDSTWLNPASYLNASVVQLFYANNAIHDIMYNYGFDENGGNFQFNNYGKGGKERDWVQGDAQDGSGTGNANFSTPVDGSSGRMQMFLWPVGGSSGNNNSNLNVTKPTNIMGIMVSPLSQFGPKQFTPINSQVVLVDDGTAADSLGCNTLTNTSALNGKIALIYRGTCGFTTKVLNAQNAGAIAVIVIQSGTQSATAMTGSNPAITIPSVMVSRADGTKLKNAIDLGDTVVVTLSGAPQVKTYDSDFDNGVIAHEYGHGISTRLTGGPNNSSCLQSGEQAGEGWSDFFALALTAKASDRNVAKGIGTFVVNQNTAGLGIRAFKYTRDMLENPMTYNYVKNNQGVHYVGTVWCSMLNDIFWDMVDKYGFNADIYNGTGGNNKTLRLVMEGLKLQPCNPGFVDARDAIILADSLLYGGTNKDLLWKAFARRGLGFSANQGLSSSVTDGIGAFDVPPRVIPIGLMEVNLASYIQLTPNPTNGLAYLVLPDQLTQAELIVTDIAGKTIINTIGMPDANQHLAIDLSSQANGIYFVNLKQGATNYQSKLVLAH